MEPNENYNAVLIEDLLSQFKFVIEKVEGSEQRLASRMDQKFAAHDEQLTDIRLQLKFLTEQAKTSAEQMKAFLSSHTLKLGEHEARFNALRG